MQNTSIYKEIISYYRFSYHLAPNFEIMILDNSTIVLVTVRW